MVTAKKAGLLVKNIGQLVTMRGPTPRRGDAMREIDLLKNAAVAVQGDTIVAVGLSTQIERDFPPAEDGAVLDAGGRVVTPGLIDPHTHPIFSRTRENEFEMRIQGRSYMEIAQAGGGIRASVRDLRETSKDKLVESSRKTLDRMLAHGVTTVEAKSGYGLSTESELKQLEAIAELDATHPVDLTPTFLGAHEFPDEYRQRRQEYVELVINEMIPAVAERRLAEYSDVFCEDGVFDIEQSRRIQMAAKAAGMKLRFHADELTPYGGAELAAEMTAASADHLVYISDHGISALARSGTVAVLLPGTTFSLGSGRYAPARKMIEAGVVVALATDCNPGSSYTESLPFVVSLAAVQLKMTAAEALAAVTVNAAYSLDRADRIGQLAEGYQADLVIWDMKDYRELPYHYAVNLAAAVVKKGAVVHATEPSWNAVSRRGFKQ